MGFNWQLPSPSAGVETRQWRGRGSWGWERGGGREKSGGRRTVERQQGGGGRKAPEGRLPRLDSAVFDRTEKKAYSQMRIKFNER